MCSTFLQKLSRVWQQSKEQTKNLELIVWYVVKCVSSFIVIYLSNYLVISSVSNAEYRLPGYPEFKAFFKLLEYPGNCFEYPGLGNFKSFFKDIFHSFSRFNLTLKLKFQLTCCCNKLKFICINSDFGKSFSVWN